MRIIITTNNDEFASVEVSDEMSLADLLALAQVEAQSLAGVDNASLQVFFNGKPLVDRQKSLKEYNIANEDMLMILSMGSASAPAMSSQASITNQFETVIDEYLDKYHSDPMTKATLDDRAPALADACRTRNRAKIREILDAIQRRRIQAAELESRLARADANNIEAQKLIYEHIRKERIDESLAHAMEHTPEAFAQVHMLYVDTKINGQPVKVFVDCGAQSTIMSKACAERCNLTCHIDERFAGQAIGVGVQKIVGRIHWAQMQMGNIYMHVSFSVLEDQPMDVLLGLDMLKRHQCSIDLHKGVLRIGSHQDYETPFLAEHQLPAHARLGAQVSPISPGLPSTTTESKDRLTLQNSPVQTPDTKNIGHFDSQIRKLMNETGCNDAELVKAQLDRAKGDEELAKTYIFIKNMKK